MSNFERTGIKILDFHRTVEIEIQFHGRTIRSHRISHLYHLICKRLIDVFHSEMLSSMNHFQHLLVDEFPSGWMLEQQVGLCVESHSHAIERHVPHSLLPSRFFVIDKSGLHTCLSEIREKRIETLGILATVIPKIDATITLMAHPAWFGFGRANESKSCHQGGIGKHSLHVGFHTDTVLNENDDGFGPNKGGRSS